MTRGWFGVPMPARLRTWPTEDELARMVRHPSAYAPTASEVLAPTPAENPSALPCPADLRLLLQAILDHPDDDAPRWAFATALQTRDPVRGALIQRQLANPQLVEIQENPGEFATWGARDVKYRRGFAEQMSLAGRAFVNLSDSLFASTPLREVRFVAVRHLLDELVQSPNLAKLQSVDFSGNRLGDLGVKLLAQCDHLVRIPRLNLTGNSLTDASIPNLIGAVWAKSIAELHLTAEEFSMEGQRQLRAEFGKRLLLA